MYQHARHCLPVHSLQSRRACRLQTLSSSRCSFTTCQPLHGSYADTLPSLRINSNTRVIFQGFTGKQATANAKDSLAWGTKIVGGVTPGRTGEHLGLPVLPSVRQAMEQLKPDATAIYVAAHQAPGAIEEAIEAEVPLIVAVAEHIPVHDMLRIHSILKTQSKSRLVGPNSPGIISAVGKCRIGFQPLPCFSSGRVGIVAKSGTLSYETVASTTRAGLGQSLCIGVGGDMAPGTDLIEALSVLEKDPDTEAIALIGEIGGMGELEAAAWIKEYYSRSESPKPIVGLIAGANEAPGRIMGHAGAFTFLGEPTAKAKITALEEAGVALVNHPAKIGDILKTKLQGTAVFGTTSGSNPFASGTQRRQLHSMRGLERRPLVAGPFVHKKPQHQQRRSIYLEANQCFDELRARGGINCGPYSGHDIRRLLAVGIDRSARSPAILVAPSIEDWMEEAQRTTAPVKSFPFDYRRGPDDLAIERIASHLQLSNKGDSAVDSLRRLIKSLTTLFYEREGLLLTTHIVERLGEIKVVHARFAFDQATFRNGTPSDKIKAMHVRATDEPAEIEAERSGIVYVKLPGADATIGTLVNGAGLAMNTVDALADAGGKAANFLDTGGKATSETVKESFRLILQDPRVKVVFVNIFGGLTLGDMIARGIIMAFKELSLTVPVVVRIRGTNEEEGQKIIAESGLPLYAFDDFEEAAAKAIELSRK
ncbi:succinyl-CoA synthetase-like protein [Pseudoneurospora amorphoporcata]|uniref:Succinyl-CoA synthetase-like protein n=1 Tax=Pseudoneurospora amorphoporcata TaxID=241081 RepID=A0AAN6NUT2_9PEZI|nr:succinyl-CoA synthetase-like protein [Pseudoneurospora amorphoporcata]